MQADRGAAIGPTQGPASILAAGIVIAVALTPASLCAEARSVVTPNPLPTPIVQTELMVRLADVARAPASSPNPPRANLNYLFHAGDESGRLFVADTRGPIHIIRDGRVLPEPFLDLRALRGDSFRADVGQRGLRSFAFHPDFAREGAAGFGKVYTAHTETTRSALANPQTPRFVSPIGKAAHDDLVAEWTVDPANPDQVAPESRREVLRIAQPLSDNNIGLIAFNPNARPGDTDYGKLYVAVGNGGSTFWNGQVAQYRQSQDTTTVLGSLLRIDPLARDGRAYTVPDDNPLVGDAHARPEIWAYGLRNPQRFAWDTAGDDKMLIADVGGANVQEVNLGIAGANYGWAAREGTFVVDRDDQDVLYGLPVDDGDRGYTYPVLQYDHDEGPAIVGGFVYRGRAIPALQGKYVFGDIVNGRLFFADADGLTAGRRGRIHELVLHYRGRETTLRSILGEDNRVDLRFGMDAAGEIYVLTKTDGMIRTLRPGPAAAEAPEPGRPPPATTVRTAAPEEHGLHLDLERFDLRDLIDTGNDAFGPN